MIKFGTGKKSFYFRGCGWSKKDISWCEEDEKWIIAMHQLFQLMYGKDTPGYAFGKGKGACARIEETDDPRPLFQYDHNTWEANYEVFIGSLQTDAAKLCKSLKPQLDLCSQQSEVESVASASFTELPNNSSIPVSCAEAPTLSSDSSPTFSVLTSATAASNSSIIHVDLTEATPSDMLGGNAAWLKTLSNLTRKELSNIVVPQVSGYSRFPVNVTSVFGLYNEEDPLSLHERPPERIVEEAEKALRRKKCQQEPTGVAIANLGTFSRNGIAILKKFCEISSLKGSIRTEERWLQIETDDLSVPEISAIKDILWNKSSSETVLRAGQKSIDVASFSTLVEERYLDNFVIDVTILKFLQDCQGSKALYLPSETHTWLQTNHQFLCRKVVNEVFSNSREEEFDLLLCPLHMNQSHWGLIAIDLVGKKLLFDDGYKLQPDSSILPSMKYLLDVLHELRPNAQCFSSSFWSTADHFERFGMPSQHDCDSTGQGSGSCGVGVILAARDFIFRGPSNAVCQVGWKYTQMRKLRKQLMIQIIAWASA